MRVHLQRYGLPLLPEGVVDRDGRRVSLEGDVWRCNVASKHVSMDWSRLAVGNIIVNYALRRWVIMLLTQKSGITVSIAAESTASALSGASGRSQEIVSPTQAGLWQRLADIDEPRVLRPALSALIKHAVQVLREHKQLTHFYVVRRWYVWCAEMLACLGFDEQFARELDEIQVPVPPSRLAVDLEDEDQGPLWDVEVTLLRRALNEDTSMKRVDVMQRAAVALCLAYGRNPANFCLLRETDLSNLLQGFDVPPQWVLAIPRIKKRGCGARQAFVQEPVSDELLKVLQQLIEVNKTLDCGHRPRPLFMRDQIDKWHQGTDMGEFAYHLTSTRFCQHVSDFARRMGLISPRTLRPIWISGRRLRYTFATAMVELGVSRAVLATMLDHSDTRHVHVYYALKGRRMTRILDRAAALKLSPLMDLFRGKIVGSGEHAVNGGRPDKRVVFVGDMAAIAPVDIGACGQSGLCALDPPFSCYVCAKFQPYRQANHGAVLDALIEGRDVRAQRYGTRVAVQLDEVIYAVAQVVRTVEAHAHGNRQKT